MVCPNSATQAGEPRQGTSQSLCLPILWMWESITYTKHFTCSTSFPLHNNPMKENCHWTYSWRRHQGSEGFVQLLKVTQPGRGRATVRTCLSLSQGLSALLLHYQRSKIRDHNQVDSRNTCSFPRWAQLLDLNESH